jgi:hypothetical protein
VTWITVFVVSLALLAGGAGLFLALALAIGWAWEIMRP